MGLCFQSGIAPGGSEIISQNVLIQLFQKVNSFTKSSTHG